MIKLLKRRIIRYITSRFLFFFFFVNVFLCVFKTVSTQLNLIVCNILSKRILKHRPSAQNTFIDVRKRKGEYRTVYGPVPNRLPVISMSTRSHDKTVETPDNPVYDVLFFFFVSRFFVCFQESFNTTVSSQYSVCRWIFFSKRPP